MNEKLKEKEKVEKIKALRRELEEKIEEQLPEAVTEPKIRVDVQQAGDGEELDNVQAKQIIEALLFTAGKPLTPSEIRKTLRSLTPAQISGVIEELREEYQQNQRSFEIVNVAGGYEISTKKEYAPWIMKLELQKKARQVTQSALETLAILAYKQPITRAEIEELRGVDISGVLATLMERDLIKIVGKKEVPGRPFLYGTTDKFLEHFGLSSLKDLPDISEIQTLVDQSVKRDELLGTQNVIEVQNSRPCLPVRQAGEEDAPMTTKQSPHEIASPANEAWRARNDGIEESDEPESDPKED